MTIFIIEVKTPFTLEPKTVPNATDPKLGRMGLAFAQESWNVGTVPFGTAFRVSIYGSAEGTVPFGSSVNGQNQMEANQSRTDMKMEGYSFICFIYSRTK